MLLAGLLAHDGLAVVFALLGRGVAELDRGGLKRPEECRALGGREAR